MKTTQISVCDVRTSKEQRDFLELPYRLYRNHPHYVPQLRMSQKAILDTKKHPFYKTSDATKFLALQDGKVIGRIMAIYNRAYNQFHNENAGFFGFFECENNSEASRELFSAVRNWLKEKGAIVIRGPVNPSTNYESGLLVEGFDKDPAVMMVYNFDYYPKLIEANGYRKAMDMFAYDIDVHTFQYSEKLARVAERLKQKYKIHIRKFNKKNFWGDVDLIREIYNDAWSRNWGFVPFNEEEFKHIAKDLGQIYDPEVVFIAEREDAGKLQPIAFFLALPDLNRALKHVKDGRLLPFGLLKLMLHSRKINFIRILIMGVLQEYQHLGIAAVFYDAIYQQALAGKYPYGEMSWVLENNVMMNRSAELIGGKISKVYRMYETKIE
jgi:GNAT superfamily N-acetyltransferase